MSLDLDEDGYADLMQGRRRMRAGIDEAVVLLREVYKEPGDDAPAMPVDEFYRRVTAWRKDWDEEYDLEEQL